MHANAIAERVYQKRKIMPIESRTQLFEDIDEEPLLQNMHLCLEW